MTIAYLDEKGAVVVVGREAYRRVCYVDTGRAIPDSWTPLMEANPVIEVSKFDNGLCTLEVKNGRYSVNCEFAERDAGWALYEAVVKAKHHARGSQPLV